MYSESFALLDLAKQFDSLHDINNYEVNNPLRAKLDNNAMNTQANRN